jgi:hypothetical protein
VVRSLPHRYGRAMEAFESFVALAETEKLVVSEALKFPVRQQTTSGNQTHGYEVDLVGARQDRLVLASVKSCFGSYGVVFDHVAGTAKTKAHNKRFALLNNLHVRDTVVELAAERFGYQRHQVECASTLASSPARRPASTGGASRPGVPSSMSAAAPSRSSAPRTSSAKSIKLPRPSSTATAPPWRR